MALGLFLDNFFEGDSSLILLLFVSPAGDQNRSKSVVRSRDTCPTEKCRNGKQLVSVISGGLQGNL